MLNVVPFPKTDRPTITEEANAYAGRMEGEDATALVITWGTGLRLEMWGEGLDAHQILGLIEVAKAALIRGLLEDPI